MYCDNTSSGGAIATLNDDPAGNNTPKFAHIRLANPRDDSRNNTLLSKPENVLQNAGHRILRRGMPYGKQFAESRSTGDKHRGMLFICYQRDLAQQFEFIQSHWFNSVNYPQDQGPHATIVGSLRGKVGYSKMGLERFVTTKGGGYFFSPSISSLQELSKYSYSKNC
jgi:Dyp-type peroxidase family